MNGPPPVIPVPRRHASQVIAPSFTPDLSFHEQYPHFNGHLQRWGTTFHTLHDEQQYLHSTVRDLHPNVMMQSASQPRIMDFHVPNNDLNAGFHVPNTEFSTSTGFECEMPSHISGITDVNTEVTPKSTVPTSAKTALSSKPHQTVSQKSQRTKSSSDSKKTKKKRPKKPSLKLLLGVDSKGLPSLVPPTQLLDSEKQLQCPDCPRKFSWHFQLQQHARTHSGERPFVCPQCQQAYKRREHLQRHEKVHTGERPFQCEDCGKKYRRKTQLARHSRVHTGERPYSCPVCAKTFRRRGHLNRHVKLHNSKTAKEKDSNLINLSTPSETKQSKEINSDGK